MPVNYSKKQKEMTKKDLNDEIKIYQEFIKRYSKWKCMICLENFHRQQSKYYRILFSDDKIDSKILKLMSNKHLICNSCAIDYKVDKIENIDCMFCKSQHKINEIKNVNNNNETESDCIII